MGKPKRTPKPVPEHERTENHMQLFARLASIKNMHGHPGDRRPKGKG